MPCYVAQNAELLRLALREAARLIYAGSNPVTMSEEAQKIWKEKRDLANWLYANVDNIFEEESL